MKGLVVASVVSLVAICAPQSAVEAASRSLAASRVAPAMADETLMPVADEQTPATPDEQKKSGKKGKKAPSTGAPAAGAAPAPKSPPAKAAATATGAGKKPPGTPAAGSAAAAGVVKKSPSAPPAPAAAATPALPPGVPPGATMIPATGGNPPSYIVPTPSGTQIYVPDSGTGRYYNPSAVGPPPGQ